MKNRPSLIATYLYSMSTIIILFFLVVGYILINDEFKNFRRQSSETRIKAIESQTALIKDEVEKIVDYIHYQKSLARERLQQEVKARTNEAHQMASFIYKQNRDKTKSEIQALIHDTLFAISWDQGRGYYFAEDMDGTELVNRNNPDLEGVNILDIQDSNGTYLMREIIAVARSEQGEGFCSYYWNKPNQPGIQVPKISYVKYFKPLDWVIGTGKYLHDEENVIKKELKDHIRKLSREFEFKLQLGTWDGLDRLYTNSTPPSSSSSDKSVFIKNNKLITTARSGGGFIYDQQPASEKYPATTRVSYSQAIDDWHWYLSAGFDLQKVESAIAVDLQELKEGTRKKIIQIGLALLILLLCAYVIARLLSSRIKKNIKIFDNFFAQAETANTKLDDHKIAFAEFKNLAISANSMIEERLKAKEALQESEDKFFKVIENAHIPMGITRDDGQVEFLNLKFIEIFGYTLDDIPTLDKWWQKAYPDINYRKEVQKVWFSKLDKIASGEAYESTSQIRNVTCKDGSMREIKFNFTPIGRSVLVTFDDHTDENRAAREKQQLEKELHQAQKMKAIGLLAGGVAHDLNNILSGIITYPELLIMRLPADSNMKKPLTTILESGHRAAAIVSDLLTVARGVANKKESVDLNQIINDYLVSPEHNQTLRENPQLSLKTTFTNNLPTISASPVHIKKCLMNLINNSAEAIENDGEISISTTIIKLDDADCRKISLDAGEYIILGVSDNGSGISENDLEHIFEPFYSKKIMGKSGSGLGLAVVWNTMQEHKGQVIVNSDSNGTTFNLYFPVSCEIFEPESKKLPLATLAGKQEKILIVDDEPLQQEIAQQTLSELNYQTAIVSSGEEAVKWLQKEAADLIILDMIMDPGINGRETFSRIQNFRPQQKAIIVSGFSVNEELKECRKLGAGTFVKKPYTIEELGVAVKRELAERK